MNINLLAILKNDDSIKLINISSEIQNELNTLITNARKYTEKERILFDGQYKPEENQILEIKNFTLPFNTDFDNPLNLEKVVFTDIELIKALVINNNELIGFQCFDKRKIIEPNKLNIIFSSNTFSKLKDKGITIDDDLDVVFKKQDNSLLFSSYHNATKIFNLSKYFREATQQEITEFFNSEIFSETPKSINMILNSRLKKKIFLIKKNKIIDKLKEDNIFTEVKNYSKNLGLSDYFDSKTKKIKIPDDKKEIKKIICFLNEDLYKSPISQIIYETNSKIKFT